MELIERLAREAGIDPSDEYPIDAGNWVATPADLANFATLIAEECAKVALQDDLPEFGDGGERSVEYRIAAAIRAKFGD